jgi:hypothetical protein
MAKVIAPVKLAELIKSQPLVGVSGAAKILGIVPPNFRRYRDRLTEIPIEGSASAFVKAEVEELRDELQLGRS